LGKSVPAGNEKGDQGGAGREKKELIFRPAWGTATSEVKNYSSLILYKGASCGRENGTECERRVEFAKGRVAGPKRKTLIYKKAHSLA